MKVFGVMTFECGMQVRAIVAAPSRHKAGRLIGVSDYHMKQHGNQTGNQAEIIQAMKKPGTVFCKDITDHGDNAEYREKKDGTEV